MNRYVSTFRAVFEAEDDVAAAVISDQIRLNAEVDLDTEDGDTFECTQTTSNALELMPEELFERLKLARNLLINTRIKQCFHLAQDLDKIVYALQFRNDSPDFTMSGYDYGKFMDVAMTILEERKVPDE
jgi:hypothetical protein